MREVRAAEELLFPDIPYVCLLLLLSVCIEKYWALEESWKTAGCWAIEGVVN